MFARFSHVMMYVSDLKRAIEWYEGILGFQTRFAAVPHYASLYHPGLQFQLDLHPAPAGSPDIGHGPLAYFGAADLDATVAQLRAKGVKVSDPRQEGGARFTDFSDSEGNVLGLCQARQ
jgi:catechol 2,3-dioxygenase-like lactoylglutathione lyase family enzyme